MSPKTPTTTNPDEKVPLASLSPAAKALYEKRKLEQLLKEEQEMTFLERHDKWIRRAILTFVFLSTAYRYFVLIGPAVPWICKVFRTQCPPAETPIHGYVHPDYSEVKDVFRSNFKDGHEVGASFVAYVDGKLVAELYGGYHYQNFTGEYNQDSLQLVFSSSKLVTGVAVAYLVDQGILNYDKPVASYWPEFAQGNKENVTVGELMAHRAGVPALNRPPFPEDIWDHDLMADRLAAQPHLFDGESTQAYHAVTRGWYVNQLVKRVDPKGRTLGAIYKEEIMPLMNKDTKEVNGHPKYEYYLGTLEEDEYDRVSLLRGPEMPFVIWQMLMPEPVLKYFGQKSAPKTTTNAFLNPGSIQARVLLFSGPLFGKGENWPVTFNKWSIWKGESPSFSGITNARTLARFAQLMLNNGTVDSTTLFSPTTMSKASERFERVDDLILSDSHELTNGGWGYHKDYATQNNTVVGWAGAGGSVVFWIPERGIAYSYVMNFAHLGSKGDFRSQKLLRKVMEIQDRLKSKEADEDRVEEKVERDEL
ncbi:hypothetical protein HDV05_003151 [Chytridiales sp. JEL 0842]|nr:hypothetical protein HDV05_003151 [Chytridiales sp. JEL 0842]